MERRKVQIEPDRSEREPQLRQTRRWLKRTHPSIGDLEALPQRGDARLDRLGDVTLGIGDASIQALVARQERGPVAGEVVQEVLARPPREVQHVSPDAGGAGVARRPDDLW